VVDYEALLRSYRKKPLFDQSELPVQTDIGPEGIKKIIPQRDPILLIDAIKAVDAANGLISGIRRIPTTDPVFAGHFPDFPLYPGTYTLEMIGQIGLCLHYFATAETAVIAEDAAPAPVRATRILGALFLDAIRPGDQVLLLSQITENDGFFARAVGQALVNEKVCCVSAAEVCFI
jgi:3-hydroxyacyl-[acyl-carrier-protein] dehydratase